MWRSLLIAVMLIAIGGSATADGVGTLSLCQRPHRDAVITYVTGALERADKDVRIIADALEQALEHNGPERSGLKNAFLIVRNYCPPAGDAAAQAADVFCDYLLMNPAERHKPSIDTLDVALREAWPCPAIKSAPQNSLK